MVDQIFELHPNLKNHLTKELVLKTCWDIEAKKTTKYVAKFPDSPKTFQWSSGDTEWLARKSIGSQQYGMFLKSSSNDTIDLCLIGDGNVCKIWDIGYDGKWTWRRNPKLEFDLDHWWNKCLNKIHMLEDVLNESVEPEFEPVLD
jgi:hypothetical protein